MKSKEIKQQIIENFIDHIEHDDAKRKMLNRHLITYIDEDHVDEITQAGFFTIEQFRKYLESQDSLGDIYYNLSEEKILLANKTKVIIIERENGDDWGYDFEFEDGTIQEDVSNSYEGAEEIAEESNYIVVNDF